jgi:hypothetical protein
VLGAATGFVSQNWPPRKSRERRERCAEPHRRLSVCRAKSVCTSWRQRPDSYRLSLSTISLSRLASRKKLIAMSCAGSAGCPEGDSPGRPERFARRRNRRCGMSRGFRHSPRFAFRWSSGGSCGTLEESRSAGVKGQSQSTLLGAGAKTAMRGGGQAPSRPGFGVGTRRQPPLRRSDSFPDLPTAR